MGMAMLVNMIIRPPRAEYPSDAASHNSVKSIQGRKYVKKIFTVTNDRGNKLSCMFYEPVPEERPQEKMPCVVYMHGNAGCRLEAEEYAPALLTSGINLFAFDFSGCGQSEGEWVTLGWKERKDLAAVLAYLQGLGSVSKIGLWGRSMGAATSVMFMSENIDTVNAAVLDSGFSSCVEIANHIASNQFGIPPDFV